MFVEVRPWNIHLLERITTNFIMKISKIPFIWFDTQKVPYPIPKFLMFPIQKYQGFQKFAVYPSSLIPYNSNYHHFELSFLVKKSERQGGLYLE